MLKSKPYKGVDLTGRTFGKLTVLSRIEGIVGPTKWNCICECGNKTQTSTSNFTYHGVSGCRRCSNIRHKKYQEIPYEFLYRMKKNAKNRNHEFSITMEYIWDLFIKQGRKCAISGLDISMGQGRDYSESRTASLDRKDSSKGYVEGNVQWIHKKINKMKMDLSDEDFIAFCITIADFRRSQNVST